jgi:hypothetical protein
VLKHVASSAERIARESKFSLLGYRKISRTRNGGDLMRAEFLQINIITNCTAARQCG